MKFRKKPVVIEAVQVAKVIAGDEVPEWFEEAIDSGVIDLYSLPGGKAALKVFALEGDMVATEGDWIIRGIQGEIYPCKPSIFETTYERVEE